MSLTLNGGSGLLFSWDRRSEEFRWRKTAREHQVSESWGWSVSERGVLVFRHVPEPRETLQSRLYLDTLSLLTPGHCLSVYSQQLRDHSQHRRKSLTQCCRLILGCVRTTHWSESICIMWEEQWIRRLISLLPGKGLVEAALRNQTVVNNPVASADTLDWSAG